jgi:glycosyltransferase involved in cell wall biosynthesis
MKTSLITTVYNEQDSIADFLKSIFEQTQLPDEIIIVDGGSKDQTVQKITEFKFPDSKKVPNIKLLFKDGNRSVGRNEAIEKASGDIILISDAGCILDKDWVKNITAPFANKKVDVVAGYYKGIAKNIFQKCLIPYVLVMEDKLDKDNFLPATRSMALRKSVWKKVGKFNEKLSHNEDYVFANKLKKINAKIFFCKDAIVNWIPRTNLKQAFVMFFRFALGDAEAKLFRDKVVYIFLRYIFVVYLIILSAIERSIYLYSVNILLLVGYIVWSIVKNYRYVKNPKAFFYLPLLQIISDLAVMTGTLIGLTKNFSLRKCANFALNNKWITLFLIVYSALVLSVISWGIPNVTHPFTYHMDEWHQLEAVRAVFKYGTPNVAGAANGSMFQFFLTGLYLIPFIVLHVANVFAIKSSVTSLSIQTTVFEVLRFNTFLFGVFSTVVFAYIVKKYFKINLLLTVFLFIFNPLFITLSNYFKYDIAVLFWVLVAFLFMLRFIEKQKTLDYLLAGIFSALALSTKLEPFNLLVVYIAIFFLFTPKFYQKLKVLLSGVFLYLVVFLSFGIPDIILRKGSLVEYLSSNLSSVPNATSDVFKLGMNYWVYFLTTLYSVSFGRVFYFTFIMSLIIGTVILVKLVVIKKESLGQIINKHKYLLVVLLLIISYAVCLIPLRIGAVANRLIPLLPFMAISTAYFVNYLYKKINNQILRILVITLILALLTIQFAESYSWNTLKIANNSKVVSSRWISDNLKPGALIGLENIPIYQFLPDSILNEFYLNQYGRGENNKYRYKVINSQSKNFPKVVILTNDYFDTNYLVKSDKKLIVQELIKQNYIRVVTFTPYNPLFSFFNNRLEFYMAEMLSLPDSISIYEHK